MATSNKALRVEFDGFKGIDIPASHSGRACIKDITDFRIRDDGSLEKRSGFNPLYTNSSYSVRAAWSLKIGGVLKCYVLCGMRLYELDLETNTATYMGIVSNSGNIPTLFHYKDTAYINTASHIYKIASPPKKMPGYIPLYGKDWGTTRPGEIYQPLNLLNRYARISYVVPSSGYTSMLSTKHPITAIISVQKNGTLLANNSYYFDAEYNTINISDGVSPGDTYVAAVEFGDITSPAYEAFSSAYKSAVVGEMKDSRVFLWGSDEKNRLYVSTPVSEEDAAESEAALAESGELYFSEENAFLVGDGQKEITAVTQHYDRILIFTDGNVWRASSDFVDGELPIMSINSSAGCSMSSSVVLAGNDPVTIGKSSILRWTSDTDERNECNANSISDPIASDLNSSFFQNGISFHDIYRKELWFSEPGGDGTVWIYSIDKDRWFKFSGIPAQGFFDANGKVGFYNGKSVYAFEDDLNTDTLAGSDSSEIVASLKSGILDFGTANGKRLYGIELKGDLGGAPIDLQIDCDTGEQIAFSSSDASQHAMIKERLHSGRFTSATLSLVARGSAGQTVHSVVINAKEKIKH